MLRYYSPCLSELICVVFMLGVLPMRSSLIFFPQPFHYVLIKYYRLKLPPPKYSTLGSHGHSKIFLIWIVWLLSSFHHERASLVAQTVKCLPTVQETQVWSLGQEDPLEKETATHSSIHAWKIPWNEEPGGLQSMGSQSWTRLSDFTSLHFIMKSIF